MTLPLALFRVALCLLAFQGEHDRPPTRSVSPPNEAAATPPTTSVSGAVSLAERIATLQRSIEADEARAKVLSAELDNPDSTYVKTEAEFKDIDGQLDRLRRDLKQAESDDDAARQVELQKQIADLQPKWEETKRRFELEIESHKTRKSTLETLTTRLEVNRALLEKLRNPDEPTPTPAKEPARPAATAMPAPAAESMPAPTAPAAAVSPVPMAAEAAPALPAAPAIVPPEPDPKDEKVAKAEAAVERLAAEAAVADEELDTITRRIENLRKNITLERRLRDLARQRVAEEERETQRLRQSYWEQLAQDSDESPKTREQLDASQERLRVARNETREAENRLDELQSELAKVQSEQIAAMREAERRRKEVDRARETLQALSNPWSRHRIERWLLNNGVRILSYVAVAFIALWVARRMRKRLIDLAVLRSRRGSRDERENRAHTLVGVFHSTFVTFVYVLTTVLVLEQCGVSVTPLIGGAAVVGLAVAFGAQSLIKDYFTGFIILMEQQYMLNDVVQIGDLSGQVERITLRMTVLRALDGKVHFIPHGTITSVTNMTHGWSRAVFEVLLGYEADTDNACRIIEDVGRELRRDPLFSSRIIEDLVMLGVDDFKDSGVLLKFYIATLPLQQWMVKREFLRRLKQRFDEEGIQIPYPQLTLHAKDISEEKLAQFA